MANASGGQGAARGGAGRWPAEGAVAAARACLRSAIDEHLADARELRASDSLVRTLHDCVQQYARVLGDLGHDERSVVETVLAVFEDASFPDEPHPALRLAVTDWTLDALRDRPTGSGNAA
jgi:hypothetical protein